MSAREEAAARMINARSVRPADWDDPNLTAYRFNRIYDARKVLAAADSVMFSESAIERAADEVLNHWRQTSTGRCECGQFASKDPHQIARHLTRAVVAALREEA